MNMHRQTMTRYQFEKKLSARGYPLTATLKHRDGKKPLKAVENNQGEIAAVAESWLELAKKLRMVQ